MWKRYAAVLLAAMLMMSAGCDQQQPPSTNDPPPSEPKSTVETTSPTAPPDEKPNPPKTEPPKQSETKTPSVSSNGKVEDLHVKVYYPDESGLRLVEVDREIEVTNDADKYAAAVAAMMTPPTEQELAEIFPKRAKLLSVDVEDGVATVNFDQELQKHFVGGSAGETFLIGSVVNTLTNFDEVREVKILIDGKEVETLAGHMDLSAPLERMEYLTQDQ